MLEKFGDFGDRIIDVTLSDNKKILNINEACDNYYSVNLTKAQVQEWISDLQKIVDEMEEQIETRVMLIQDFIDEYGQQFKAGQVGTTKGKYAFGVVVDFDGYEESRKKDEEQRKSFGEGFNVVPWLAVVPVDLLGVLCK